jgi:hypothetical protein
MEESKMKKYINVLISMLIGLTLCVVTGSPVMADDTSPEVNVTEMLPANMTYDGIINPKDAVDKTKYAVVDVVMPRPNLILSFSKAISPDQKPQYIVVAFVSSKLVAITYYQNSTFHQVGLLNFGETHYTMVTKSPKQLSQISKDFEKIFGIPFPIPIES